MTVKIMNAVAATANSATIPPLPAVFGYRESRVVTLATDNALASAQVQVSPDGVTWLSYLTAVSGVSVEIRTVPAYLYLRVAATVTGGTVNAWVS